MFKYINMPKLVAFYLREFSYKSPKSGSKIAEPTNLYKFVFCLCLPFVSPTFRKARLYALAIAECTNSADQIKRLFAKLTGGATINFVEYTEDVLVPYSEYDDALMLSYDGVAEPNVPYRHEINSVYATVTLNGTSKTYAEAYLSLLIPFYVKTNINWQ